MERRVIAPESLRALAGGRKGGLVDIDGQDAACRTDELRDEHGHVAHPATDIENPHSRCDSSVAKKALRSRVTIPGPAESAAVARSTYGRERNPIASVPP
jgi:hypothetical protein